MIINKYERSNTITGEGTGAKVPVNTAGAEALGLVSKQLGALGNQLMGIAEKQQDDIRALEFAKVKGNVDTWFNDFYIAESENPDYEGGTKRFAATSVKYQEQILKGVKDPQLKSAIQQYLAAKLPAFDLDMKKLYIAKQQDHRLALFTESAETFIKNNDRSGLQMLVESSSWLKDTAKQKLLSGANVEISKNMALRDMTANLDGWEFDEKMYPGLDVKEQELLKDQHETLVYRRDRNIEREQKKIYDETDNEIFSRVFSGGRLSKMEIASKIKNGQMSAESGVKWLNYFNSQSEIAANRAERMQNRLEREKFKNMTPIDQDIYELSGKTGQSMETIKGNFDKLSNSYSEGDLGDAGLLTSVGEGKITPYMAQVIRARRSDTKLDPTTQKYCNAYISAKDADMKSLGVPAPIRAKAVDQMRRISKSDVESGLFEEKSNKITSQHIVISNIPLTEKSYFFWDKDTEAGEYLKRSGVEVNTDSLPQEATGTVIKDKPAMR